MNKRAKLTQLFDQGVELVLSAGVVVWVSKLNSFMVEECNHQGRVASARRKAAIREIGSPEYELFLAEAEKLDKDQIVKALVGAKQNEHLFEVFADLRSDDEWREKVEVIEHSDEQLAGRPDDDPEKAYLTKLALDYSAEIQRRLSQIEDDYTKELSDLGTPELKERYQEQYLDARGGEAWSRMRRQYEIYLCLRDCEAEQPPDGERWDHSRCDHSKRMLDEPSDVNSLPDDALTRVRETYEALMVPQDLARFTDGPASSSASSGPVSSAGDSKPSGPSVTPSEPDTTS